GDVVSKALVQRLAESLEEQVARLPGTKETTLFGVTEEEITVTYDPAVLASYGLTPEGVASAIEASDAKATAGSLHGSGRQLTLEVAGDLTGTARIAEIPLKMLADGSVLRVGMVADIRKGLKQPLDSLALVDGQEAVFVSARMKQSQRIDLWSAQMHELVEGFQSGLPQGVAAEVMFDQSRYTSDRLSGLTVNLAVGILLVMAVLMVMMGLRSALLVGVALPLTLTMALFCFHLIGVPMHQMSVTGLIIALGLLIDNAIVTVDEFDRRRAKGATPLEAVQRTVNHLAIPLLASTTTTVLAFLPIVLMPGAAGEFVGTMGLAVILCVVISLSLAVTVIPAVASIVDRLLERRGAKAATGELEVGMPRRRPGIHLSGLSRRYRGLLGFLFRHPLLGLALGLALPIAGFVVAPTLPGQFFPPTERDQFQVQLRMSGESSLQDTRAAVERARAVLERYPEIQHDLWVIGENPPMVYYNTIFSSDNDPSFAGGFVVTESPEATGRILVSLQAALAEALPEAEILALPFEQGPPFDAPVEVELYGPDLAELERLGEEIRRVLADTPGVTFTRTTIGTGRPKLEFQA
ncbi:MAG: efflux RND transporter permease subunit, partial [Rhodospirillaceae bacterium]